MEIDLYKHTIISRIFPALISIKISNYYTLLKCSIWTYILDELVYDLYPPRPIQDLPGLFRWKFIDTPKNINPERMKRMFGLFDKDFRNMFFSDNYPTIS